MYEQTLYVPVANSSGRRPRSLVGLLAIFGFTVMFALSAAELKGVGFFGPIFQEPGIQQGILIPDTGGDGIGTKSLPDDKDAEINQLLIKIEEAEKERDAALQREAVLTEELNRLNAEIKTVQTDKAAALQRITELQDAVNLLNDQIAAAEIAKETAQQKINEMESEIDHLIETIAVLENNEILALERVAKLENEIAGKEQEIQIMSAELSRLEQIDQETIIRINSDELVVILIILEIMAVLGISAFVIFGRRQMQNAS